MKRAHENSIISRVSEENRNIKTFYFKVSEENLPLPGQFYMVWVPGVDEVPISAGYIDSQTMEIGLTILRRGDGTSALLDYNAGDRIFYRGPYGKGFDLSSVEKVILAGGGVGLPPVCAAYDHLVSGGKKAVLCGGFRTVNDLIYRRRYDDMKVATDDGSYGYHGFLTGLVIEQAEITGADSIICCGPEIMMKKLFDYSEEKGIYFQASLERYMKCGAGICDSCSADGFQVCRDGPVFSGTNLRTMLEFGRTHRNPDGSKHIL